MPLMALASTAIDEVEDVAVPVLKKSLAGYLRPQPFAAKDCQGCRGHPA